MKFASIPEFVAFLRTRPAAVEVARRRGMEAAAETFQTTARDMIGEEIPSWADLAPATVGEKARLGYRGHVSDTDPLLRTGELRASIHGTVDGMRVVLGTDDVVAEWQEFGTARIPPRPFIAPTVHNGAPEAAHLIANHELGAAMGLRGPLKPVQRRDGERD
jgi:hypothetical protein